MTIAMIYVGQITKMSVYQAQQDKGRSKIDTILVLEIVHRA